MEESEQIISQFLDLPEGIDLSTFEPLGAVFTNEEEAQAFILRATPVVQPSQTKARDTLK